MSECIVCGERFLIVDPEVVPGKLSRLVCRDCRIAGPDELLIRNRRVPWRCVTSDLLPLAKTLGK